MMRLNVASFQHPVLSPGGSAPAFDMRNHVGSAEYETLGRLPLLTRSFWSLTSMVNILRRCLRVRFERVLLVKFKQICAVIIKQIQLYMILTKFQQQSILCPAIENYWDNKNAKVLVKKIRIIMFSIFERLRNLKCVRFFLVHFIFWKVFSVDILLQMSTGKKFYSKSKY